jgi:hypothetical protein
MDYVFEGSVRRKVLQTSVMVPGRRHFGWAVGYETYMRSIGDRQHMGLGQTAFRPISRIINQLLELPVYPPVSWEDMMVSQRGDPCTPPMDG